LLVWPVLKLSSIHCFCSELCQYLKANAQRPARPEDIIYEFWSNEDINWRGWAREASRRVATEVQLGSVAKRAFVTDDSIRKRRGKKVEGSSRHYDHTSGTTVAGHQILELGLAGENGFLPVDRQHYMSECAPVEKPSGRGDFKDKRAAAARDMARARDEEKPAMLARMLKDALKAGFKATWLIGDAWFGSKANIRLAIDHGLHALFQMKRGKLQYRVGGSLYTATELYVKNARRMRAANSKSRFKTVRIEAEIDLETKPSAEPIWHPVVLVLSAPKEEGKDNWVIFLSTNTTSSVEHLLEIYALRWSIEVYFKELKQSFGLLSEQSGKYQVAYASIHLAAVRYMIIFEAMLRNGSLSFGQVRDLQSGKLQILSFAALLWNLFRSIISGALDQFEKFIGKARIQELVAAIDGAVEDFLSEALQISPSHVQALAHAEAFGALES
jgi:DDE superfamily endonuclease